ncbi:hypothetical protein VTN96DRAFT_10319 [Rasamsonia emersonii]|uniref:Copper-dependent polysaccharide monooxygenase n=1 Tax=Rasamsonia emersonii (strain ATCC 16479 / CBS 393.64 / IMI 116815) TaxID=1408163 RepID=A0A0F4YKJ0_RASE3|nr:copper-dependent polysaccharide monooxygenase [Rasamsonia emersonii CBS 393.64]KKA18807.1 copper-dependent polysaccharide monooxygenase [Rasamsonia emersonii CBS 393.64]
MLFSVSSLAAALLSASAVSGHMIMRNPIPYGVSTLNNSPLAADGSDFPCKLRKGVYDITEMNNMTIGENNPLDFYGSATHGGGSCQISLTTDAEPTKDSKWMVIHSIEGGCPANVPGNLDGGPMSTGASTFQFKIPEGIEPGRYTLAWTWFNRIGNREMYMNCAPVNVLPASSTPSNKRDATEEKQSTSLSKRTNFPDLFVANINGCMTKEGVDIRFPDPGDSVEYDGDPSNLQPVGQPACTGGPGPGPSGSAPAGTSPAATSSAASTPAASSSTPIVSVSVSAGIQPTVTAAPGVFATSASSIAAPSAASTSASPNTPSSSSAASPSASGTPSSSGSSSSSGALSGPCSPDGQWNCIGGNSFQRCASGVWSAVESLAEGTACTTGQSTELKIAATKRDASVSHLHRRRIHLPSQLQN